MHQTAIHQTATHPASVRQAATGQIRTRRHLFVFGSLRRDGAQLRTLDVCRVLRERYSVQFDFCVIRSGPIPLQAEIEGLGGTIHVTPIHSPTFVRQFSQVLRQGQYDVIEIEPKLLSGLLVWLAERHRVPIRIVNLWNMLGEMKGYLSWPAFVWVMRRLMRRSATHIVAVSEAALESVLPQPLRQGCHTSIIYSGLPMQAFRETPQRDAVRAEFGWPAESQVAINVARFFDQKNHPTIIEAIRLAHARNPRLRLLLVGDGKYQEAIIRLVHEQGLDGVCVFAGVRKDVPRLLLASDLFLFPSLWEGLPGALLEALAAGLPAVTSDIPPMREIASHFPESLWMAAPLDAEAHARHMLEVLETPYDRTAAQAHFEQSPFTLDHTIQAYSRLYGLA